jgi:hypothetical protein
MLSTVQRAVTLLLWQEKQQQRNAAGSSSCADPAEPQQQQQHRSERFTSYALRLVVECVLLVPTDDMASSCLELIPLLTQQAHAAVGTAVGACLLAVSSALHELGLAVNYVVGQAESHKQRRLLMRLWAGAVEALLQWAGGFRLQPV